MSSQPVGMNDNDGDEEKIEPHHIEDGFRHMVEAEKVKQNPKLLAKVQEHAQKQGHALNAINAYSSEPAPGGAPAKSTKELRAMHAKMAMPK